jgi:hypothetical protein
MRTRRSFEMAKRPSAALVVAAVALFLSTTGTAVAAVIITDNSQVAAHTIAGAQAPSGDNQNIIPGTIASKDLADGTVTAAKLDDNARTHKIEFFSPGFGARVLAQIDGFTFGATCEPNVPSSGVTTLLLNVGNSADPPALVTWSYVRTAGTGTVAGTSYGGEDIVASGSSENLPNLVSNQSYPASVRYDGQIVFNGGTPDAVVTVIFHASALASRSSPGCRVIGDAVEAVKK